MLVCVIAFQQLISKARLASVLQAASLGQRLLSPNSRGQPLRRVFPRQTLLRPDILSEKLLERQGLCRGCPIGTIMPHVTAYGILAVQALFFLLGGIRDNFMTGKVIMPDEEYLQSWWYGVPLGTSETHSDRMECTANGWGTFIGIIALSKMVVALTGGKTTLAKTLGALYVLGNVWTIKVFLPMNDLMEAHGTAWPSTMQSKAP